MAAVDERKYDSENEDYDSEDYAQTLALGTMMLRQSKAKALVDASYNRFAWNDPEGLPDWFVDDENRNYRPQLPIPQALIDKIKAKQLVLSSRPIAKVAEARARKNKRAKLKLTAAKKKAEVVAASGEMSEAMKLKAISKAMRGRDSKNPGKQYVVARKGGSTGGKGVKLVDKRERSDKRAMARTDKKRKKGKQNGMTGSKKRRSHS
jgi:AdoMet-dependent rRNA methyltransferase SPB1